MLTRLLYTKSVSFFVARDDKGIEIVLTAYMFMLLFLKILNIMWTTYWVTSGIIQLKYSEVKVKWYLGKINAFNYTKFSYAMFWCKNILMHTCCGYVPFNLKLSYHTISVHLPAFYMMKAMFFTN